MFEGFACFRVFTFGIFEESKHSKAIKRRAMTGQTKQQPEGGVQQPQGAAVAAKAKLQ